MDHNRHRNTDLNGINDIKNSFVQHLKTPGQSIPTSPAMSPRASGIGMEIMGNDIQFNNNVHEYIPQGSFIGGHDGYPPQ